MPRKRIQRQGAATWWLATGAAVAVLGAAAFPAGAVPAPHATATAAAKAAKPNPRAVAGMRLAEGENPCNPCSPNEAEKLCFDLNVGRPVPCTSMHKEEAEPDGRDFMTPHSGPRGESE